MADAVYVECDEDHADAVVQLVEGTLTCEKTLCEGAPPMAFTASAHAAKNWRDAA